MSEPGKNRILDVVSGEVASRFPDYENCKFVAGVSGGVDSMTLLYILKQLELDVTVVHVNYQKRGVESDRDAALVEAACHSYGYDFRLFLYPPEMQAAGNFQEQARAFRRARFGEIAREQNAAAIILAHHLDDLTETMMQRLFRGAGILSLQAMQVFDEPLFRPLLTISRAEIIAFAGAHQVSWREDASNRSSGFSRNWLRNELHPDLDRFLPGWQANLHRHVGQLAAVGELLDVWLKEHQVDTYRLELNTFESLSEDAVKAILHHWFQKMGVYVTRGEVGQAFVLMGRQPGTHIQLSEQFRLVRNQTGLELQRITGEPSGHPVPVEIPDTGSPVEVRLPGIRLNLVRGDRPADPIGEDALLLDPDTLKLPLRVGTWQDGDRFQPFGLKGEKLVSDLLTDIKIASSQKKSACKISDFDGKICAVIFPHPARDGRKGCISEPCRITESTRTVLKINISYEP